MSAALFIRSPLQRRVSLGFGAGSLVLTLAFVGFLLVNRTHVVAGQVDFVENLLSVVALSFLGAVLAGAYLGSVLLLQGAFQALTGESRGELVTVLSTLACAALFLPLRAWLQAAIDRRFYRRKYDAARTLARFAASARDETNLERLSARLVDVVHDTMQPAHAALWLRPKP